MSEDGMTAAECQVCHKQLFKPYVCRKCGGTFCSTHASPKRHKCPSIKARSTVSRRVVRDVSLLLIALVIVTALLILRPPKKIHGEPWRGNVSFVDVTDRAGLGVVASGHGLGVEDLDGDGDLDLYVVNKDGNLFYRNNGDGTFTDVTDLSGVGRGPGGGHGVAIGDYDNDGDEDIFSANWGGQGIPNLLYRNEGNFTFKDVTKEAGVDAGGPGNSHSACMGDYNGDGWLDIIATNTEGVNFYFQNKRNGEFLYSTDLGSGSAPHGLVSVDYDLDGDLDVYLSNQAWKGKPAGNVFYINSGRGFLRKPGSLGLRGETHSSFFGDFDGDGDWDFFGVDRNSGGKKAYYRNLGKRFKEVSSQVGAFGPKELVHGMDCADFDLDGDLDVLLTGGHETFLLANDGTGVFEDITEKVGLKIDFGNPKSVCFFDYDGDGDLDIYVVVAGGSNRLFESRGCENSWVKIDLEGTESNRDGIGARLEILAGGRKQYREVPSGRGHIHDPMEQVVGIGSAEKIDSITVRWPSGKMQVIEDVPARSHILITEGDGWRILR